MLRPVDQDIWVAEQPMRYFGLSVGARMTAIRLQNQEIVVISPVQPTEELVAQLDRIGAVAHIIAPNLYHYFFAADFKAHYPTATFWAAPGLKEKRPELPIDYVIEPVTVDASGSEPWNCLDFFLFEGFRTLGSGGIENLNECVFFHRASRTLVITDIAFHFDESFPLLTRLATQVGGGYKQLSPSVLEKIATRDKAKIRQSVDRVLEWDFERVIMAHGSIIELHGKEKFRRGYEAFLG
jgi:hypothetical protein